MTTIILISIYLVSIPLCLLSNKWAYKKADASIIPIVWFIPLINSCAIFILIFSTLLEYANKGILKSSYWKQRW